MGKSTLIRRLHNLVGGKVIDADLGQSEIGPPACVSLGDYEHVEGSYFVGDISPRGNFLQLLSAVGQAVQAAKGSCLIDTDGYIKGSAARALKGEMVNLVRPDALVLLQRHGELNYFELFARKGIEVIKVRVAHQGAKSHEERIRAREEAFRDYFKSAKLHRWPMEGIRFERSPLGHGEPVELGSLGEILGCRVLGAWLSGEELTAIIDGYAKSLTAAKELFKVDYIRLINLSSLRGLLVGCLVGGRLQGLGILRGINNEQIEVLTPAKEATVLQVGRLIVSEDGSHHRLSGPT